MVDQRSVELHTFNFASKNFAYRRLAKSLSRSLSAFSNLMVEFVDSLTKTDQRSQYVDDICIASSSPEQLITTLRAVFKCIQKAEIKKSTAKRHSKQKKLFSSEELSH